MAPTGSSISTPSNQRSTPRPDRALLASAQRMTQRKMKRGFGKGQSWQNDAWDMFDLVGEARFLATMLANRMSQAQFFVGQVPQDPTEEPVPVENNPQLTDILDALGGSASARSQMFTRLGINLFVTGDAWLVGIPRHRVPESLLTGTLNAPDVDVELLLPPEELEDTIDIATLEWRTFSVNEVTGTAGGEVTLRMGESPEDQLIISPDELMMVRVWRSHPRRWWEADSPIRSSLSVLRELVGLTMRSSAEIDSRLAGAGLLIVPHGAQRALAVAAGIDDVDLESAPDQFTEALMEAMLTPIQDRASASAVVPLVVTVPDELVGSFNFIDFAKPLDEYQSERIDLAIRRLALGLDAPPELLLGTGGMSHWGAWLVLEDVVSTHLEPPLALIADALTNQYLWPVLMAQGMSEDEARQYVIWYDVSDLVVRPTRSADAQSMHAAGVISDASLRTANGFDDSDAPAVESPSNTPAIEMALDMIRAAPGLMSDPGLPQLVAQIQSVLEGNIPEVIDPVAAKAAAASASAARSRTPVGDEQGAANTADTGPGIRLAPPVGPVKANPTGGSPLAASGAPWTLEKLQYALAHGGKSVDFSGVPADLWEANREFNRNLTASSSQEFKITKSDSSKPTQDKKGDDSGTTSGQGPGVTRDQVGRFAPGGSGTGGKEAGDPEVEKLDKEILDIEKQLQALADGEGGGSGGSGGSGGGSSSGGGGAAGKGAAKPKSDAQKKADAIKARELKAKKAEIQKKKEEIRKKVTDARNIAEADQRAAETKRAVDKANAADARNIRSSSGARTSTPAKEATKKAAATKPGTDSKPGNVTSAPSAPQTEQDKQKADGLTDAQRRERRDRGLTASGGWGTPRRVGDPARNVFIDQEHRTLADQSLRDLQASVGESLAEQIGIVGDPRLAPGITSAADFPSTSARAAQEGQR